MAGHALRAWSWSFSHKEEKVTKGKEMEKTIHERVKDYFQRHQGASFEPRAVHTFVDWQGRTPHLEAVRRVLNKGVQEGWLTRVQHSPSSYRYRDAAAEEKARSWPATGVREFFEGQTSPATFDQVFIWIQAEQKKSGSKPGPDGLWAVVQQAIKDGWLVETASGGRPSTYHLRDRSTTVTLQEATGEGNTLHLLTTPEGAEWVTNRYWSVPRKYIRTPPDGLTLRRGDLPKGAEDLLARYAAQTHLYNQQLALTTRDAEGQAGDHPVRRFYRPDGTPVGIRKVWADWIEQLAPSGHWKAQKETSGKPVAYFSQGKLIALVMPAGLPEWTDKKGETPAEQAVGCPVCPANAGEPCLNTVTGRSMDTIHGGRSARWDRAQREAVTDIKARVRQFFEEQPGTLKMRAQLNTYIGQESGRRYAEVTAALQEGIRDGWLYGDGMGGYITTSRGSSSTHREQEVREDKIREDDPQRQARQQYERRAILRLARKLYGPQAGNPGFEEPLFSLLYTAFEAYNGLHATPFDTKDGDQAEVARAIARALAIPDANFGHDAGTTLLALQENWEDQHGEVK